MNKYSEKQTRFYRIQSIEDDLNQIKNILFVLKSTDICKTRNNYAKLSMDAALKSENITCRLRNLVYGNNQALKKTYMDSATEAQQIIVNRENNILSIQLPGLLPKRKLHVNMSFLYEPLNHALYKFQQDHNITYYTDCVVCFCHIYDRNLSTDRSRDYDNLECKQILDVIASYILVDDTSLLCDLYHTMEYDNKDCTMIYVMEKSKFPEWLIDHQNCTKNISENS